MTVSHRVASTDAFSSSEIASDRYVYVDILTCLMYFAIILYHSTIYFARYSYSTLPHLEAISVAGRIDFVMMSFGLLGVPFFFVRIGFFMLSKQRAHFLSRNLFRLIVLAAFYIVTYSVILVCSIGDLDHLGATLRFALLDEDAGIVGSASISKIPMYFVWDSWFIYALIPLYFTIPLLAKTEAIIDRRAASIAMAGVYFFAFVQPAIFPPLGLGLVGRDPNEIYFAYILLGYWIFCVRQQLASVPYWFLGAAFIILMILDILLGKHTYLTNNQQYFYVFRGYGAVLTPLLCVVLFSLGLSAKWRVPASVRNAVSFVARSGIDIYLLHTLFLVLFLGATVLPDTALLPAKQIGYAVLIMVASIAGAWVRQRLFQAVGALFGRPVATAGPASEKLPPG
jgi:hypothetical protein